jgi:AraC-like DNA-binding protein
VYISNGVGKRKVGLHLSNFSDGELILIGSNVPHHGFTNNFENKRFEVVVHFKASMLGTAIEETKEFSKIKQLLDLASNGVIFNNQFKHQMGKRLLHLMDESDFKKIFSLMDILNEMAQTDDKTVLNAKGDSFLLNPRESDRINKVFNYIEKNYSDPISLEDVAQIVFMSPSSFSRFFKKTTSKTFVSYLNQYRINNAIKLLLQTDKDVQSIGYECGFNNIPNFFRQFKKQTNFSPNEYRKIHL